MFVFGRRTNTPRGSSSPAADMTGSLGFFLAAFVAALSSAAFSLAAFLAAAFSAAAAFLAAFLSTFSASGSSLTASSSPFFFLELDPRRNTITLLNLSLLELSIDAADRFVGRRFDDFKSAKIFRAAGNFQRIAGLEAVVGANRHFNELRAGAADDLDHEPFDGRHDRARIGIRIDSVFA